MKYAVCFWALLLTSACTPYTLSKTSTAYPPKDANCAVTVLAPGQTPEPPFVNVGVVHLKSCPSYTEQPCRRWLQQAACKLGGDVAYRLDDSNLELHATDVTEVITVAVSTANIQDAPPPPKGDGDCNTPQAGAPETDVDHVVDEDYAICHE